MGTLHSLEELYHHYREPVQHYLYRLSNSTDQAEELTQETFIKAGIGILTFRGESSVATWLFRIARNTYLNSVRGAKTYNVDIERVPSLFDSRLERDPARQHAANEQRDQITRALGTLSEKQRSILLLRDLDGLSYSEIADVMGMGLSAVKVNLFRARNAFRAAYTALEESEGEEPCTTK